MDVLDRVRDYWNQDAATYDLAGDHGFASPAEQAAWTRALERLLPPAPSRVLDAGAGTGFLSLTAARLGHQVTALDLSPRMLERLRGKASAEGLDIYIVEGPAEEPPPGPFAAVLERHLLWTLPHPDRALAAWREVSEPHGRLLLFEGLWGEVDPVEVRRRSARRVVARLRRQPPSHHREYDREVVARLPLGRGSHPDRVVELVHGSGWGAVGLERLRDVEWTRLLATPTAERLLGTTPVYVVTATATRSENGSRR